MEFVFYICGFIAVVTTLKVITHINPMRALLYLVVSLLAISGVFFSLGAYFAGALEIIVYTSAIMVMFVFVIMILNLSDSEIEKRRRWLNSKMWIGQIISSTFIFLIIIYSIIDIRDQSINGIPISPKEVGISLFGPYILAVELVSMLLLVSLIVVFHISRVKSHNEKTTTESESHHVGNPVGNTKEHI